jgi:hypothetical protein
VSRTNIRLGGKWGKLNPLAGEVGGFTSSRRYGIHDYVSYAIGSAGEDATVWH